MDQQPITIKKAYPKSPCKDCTRRTVGCHSKCEDYISYSKYRDKQNQEQYKRTTLYMNLAYIKKHGKAARET